MEESFAIVGDRKSENYILREDRNWAELNHIKMHPSVAINNITYTNSTSEDLALAICAAYREAPDECELSWKTMEFANGNETFSGLVMPH